MSSRFRFVSKRIGGCTERQRRRRTIRTPQTKARLRRAFESDLRRLIEALCRFDRLRTGAERERQLRWCLTRLEICLQEKPQCGVLRAQKRFCMEALQDLLADPQSPLSVKLQRSLEEPDGIRWALKGRIRSRGIVHPG